MACLKTFEKDPTSKPEAEGCYLVNYCLHARTVLQLLFGATTQQHFCSRHPHNRNCPGAIKWFELSVKRAFGEVGIPVGRSRSDDE